MKTLTATEPEYTAIYEPGPGRNIARYYRTGEWEATLTVADETEAQFILDDWARLDVDINDVQSYQLLADQRNTTIDEIAVEHTYL